MTKLPAAIELEWGMVADCVFNKGAGEWKIVAWYHPTIAQPSPSALAAAVLKYTIHAAIIRIDAEAEAARGAFITLGAGQSLVYAVKRQEAETWIAATAPDPAAYPLLTERADRLGKPQAQVAAEWVAQAQAWSTVAAAIESVRELAKDSVAIAADENAIQAILNGLIWPAPA